MSMVCVFVRMDYTHALESFEKHNLRDIKCKPSLLAKKLF